MKGEESFSAKVASTFEGLDGTPFPFMNFEGIYKKYFSMKRRCSGINIKPEDFSAGMLGL